MNQNSKKAVVLGLGHSGEAAAALLLDQGADVTVCESGDSPALRKKAESLSARGARILLGSEAESDPESYDLAVLSPGIDPVVPLVQNVVAKNIPVIGELELAFQNCTCPVVAITGTNGKTTTTEMLNSIFLAAGMNSIACGNVGFSLIDAVMDKSNYTHLAVELASFQTTRIREAQFWGSALLNLAEDHLDWHKDFTDYAASKFNLFNYSKNSIINADDEIITTFADKIDDLKSFTLNTPSKGQLGVVEDLLVDRAFIPNSEAEAIEIATLNDLKNAAPHTVSNALAAGGVARSAGISAESIAAGLRSFEPGLHRISVVMERDGVTWINDSKATNPHAAGAALKSFQRVIWIAGGLAKGATMDDLVMMNSDA